MVMLAGNKRKDYTRTKKYVPLDQGCEVVHVTVRCHGCDFPCRSYAREAAEWREYERIGECIEGGPMRPTVLGEVVVLKKSAL